MLACTWLKCSKSQLQILFAILQKFKLKRRNKLELSEFTAQITCPGSVQHDFKKFNPAMHNVEKWPHIP